ncbi:MAG TPA: DUF177 domain-containing protein [Bacillota bacterium]|nr:DUF177 domain-containing protein [Bacillota bacterium]
MVINSGEKIDLSALLAGEILCLPFEFRLKDFSPGKGYADIEPIGDVIIDGRIINNEGYIRLEAVLTMHYRTACARCAVELERTLHVPVERVIATQAQVEGAEDADDYLILEGEALDLAPLATEEVYLGLPMRELCSEDCRGLCPKCGKNLNEGPCSCPEREPDPRLAILSKWSEKYNND